MAYRPFQSEISSSKKKNKKQKKKEKKYEKKNDSDTVNSIRFMGRSVIWNLIEILDFEV